MLCDIIVKQVVGSIPVLALQLPFCIVLLNAQTQRRSVTSKPLRRIDAQLDPLPWSLFGTGMETRFGFSALFLSLSLCLLSLLLARALAAFSPFTADNFTVFHLRALRRSLNATNANAPYPTSK